MRASYEHLGDICSNALHAQSDRDVPGKVQGLAGFLFKTSVTMQSVDDVPLCIGVSENKIGVQPIVFMLVK
jgi:hypothetical protein